MFNNPNIETFKEIYGINNVTPYTDVSLLHQRRLLHYRTTKFRLFVFNVDTSVNTKIDVEKKSWNNGISY